MKRLLWTLSYIMAFIVAVAGAGYLGITKSIALIVAPAPEVIAHAIVPQPAPIHDDLKPTVAILLGNTATESTDFLGPYAMFAEAGVYNVYAVAASRDLRTLSGGLDVVPQLSFAELATRLPQGPDILVVPAMSDVAAPENVPVLEWLRHQGNGRTLLFSWCEGAEVLAASGLIDGKNVTTHWGSIDRDERAYPAVHWQRGERYVDAGTLLTTAGLTSGIDATLHLLEKRNGTRVAEKVTAALHLPSSPFVANPHMQQYTFEVSDSAMLLNLAFRWPKRRTGIWLYDGVGELDLTAAIDVYGTTDHVYTMADGASARSRHGLQFVPRWQAQPLPGVHRLLVPGGIGANEITNHVPSVTGDVPVTLLQNNSSPTFAFQLTLEDLAREHDTATAAFAARRLEVRTPLQLAGQRWPLRPLLMLMLAGVTGVLTLSGVSWLLSGPAPAEAYANEIALARAALRHADYKACFFHLERAHILGQRSGRKHVYAHWLMLKAGLRQRDRREVLGQAARILAALFFSRIWIPLGNTGRARVNALRPMPVPEDLRRFFS